MEEDIHEGMHVTRVKMDDIVMDGFEWDINNKGQVVLQMSPNVANKVFIDLDERTEDKEIDILTKYLKSEFTRIEALKWQVGLAIDEPDTESLREAKKAVDDYRELPF
jgi:hypothetical protein